MKQKRQKPNDDVTHVSTSDHVHHPGRVKLAGLGGIFKDQATCFWFRDFGAKFREQKQESCVSLILFIPSILSETSFCHALCAMPSAVRNAV